MLTLVVRRVTQIRGMFVIKIDVKHARNCKCLVSAIHDLTCSLCSRE